MKLSDRLLFRENDCVESYFKLDQDDSLAHSGRTGALQLSSQYPHYPAGHNHSTDKHGEAIQAVADLLAGVVALSDAENHRCENREEKSGSEMRQGQGHGFFPMAM